MVLNLKREEVGTLRNRLQIGLDKLMTTAQEVCVAPNRQLINQSVNLRG